MQLYDCPLLAAVATMSGNKRKANVMAPAFTLLAEAIRRDTFIMRVVYDKMLQLLDTNGEGQGGGQRGPRGQAAPQVWLRDTVALKEIRETFYVPGHVPGSAMLEIQAGKVEIEWCSISESCSVSSSTADYEACVPAAGQGRGVQHEAAKAGPWCCQGTNCAPSCTYVWHHPCLFCRPPTLQRQGGELEGAGRRWTLRQLEMTVM